MTISPEQPVHELKLSTTAELCAALRAPDTRVNLATLSAIIADPDKAMAFTTCDGCDLVDELAGLVTADRPSLLRTTAAAALFSLNDKRSLEPARRIFSAGADLEIMFLAGRRIAAEGERTALEYFLPYLYDHRDVQRQRLAAVMLAACAGLTPADRLQVALLAGETGAEPPRLGPGTLQVWLDALQGDRHNEARGFLTDFGEESFLFLKDNWNRLDPATKAWLVSWGASDFPGASADLVIAALSGEDPELQLAALEAMPRYEHHGATFRSVLHKVAIAGRDKRWSVAAIRAGAQVENLHDRVFSERDPDIRKALIQRLKGENHATGVLARLLEDSDWRIRATAADILVSEGDSSVNHVSVLLNHEDIAVRTAAAQVLIRLGRNDQL
jgi:HEAT repeat protein